MKIKALYTLILVCFCVLFVSPNTAKSGVNCGDSSSGQPSIGQALNKVSAEASEEDDTDFIPITNLIPGYSILFN